MLTLNKDIQITRKNKFVTNQNARLVETTRFVESVDKKKPKDLVDAEFENLEEKPYQPSCCTW